jgi:hypothetical protein
LILEIDIELSPQSVQPSDEKMLNRIYQPLGEEYYHDILKQNLAILTRGEHDVYQVQEILESFNSIVARILIQACYVYLFEDGDFELCKVIVEEE